MAALTEGNEWLDHLVPHLAANHEFAESYIRENIPMVRYRKADATFLAWIDVSQVIGRVAAGQANGSQAAQRWFAENSRVFLTPGQGFGGGGATHMRMNIATPRALLRQALQNMAGALAVV